MKQFINLLNGEISMEGNPVEVLSPIDNIVLGNGHIVSKNTLDQVFEKSHVHSSTKLTVNDLKSLAEYLEKNKSNFIDQIILETGYIRKDSQDIVEGSIELVKYYFKNLKETSVKSAPSKFSYAVDTQRELIVITVPYGIVAAMTPQNAPLILELTVLLNSLVAGNSIILRPSGQCVGTATMLIHALIESFPKDITRKISIVSCKATDFLDLSYKKANLIHYIGSSFHGKKILSDSLIHNCRSIVDGEGSSTVIIDSTASLKEAVKACRDGLIRCNGELCSTVRTMVVDERIYDKFTKLLMKELSQIKVGDPRADDHDMGPLFHIRQAETIKDIAKKYALLTRKSNSKDNYISPIVCQLQAKDIEFLNEDFFGPLAGIVPYKGDEWKKWLTGSKYPLNSCVFSNNEDFINEYIRINRSPRVIINHDPSIESVFEPWGAYLPSGQNDVSYWISKYQKKIQIDKPKKYEN